MGDSGASFFPVGVPIRGAQCLIVGGGRVAERKVRDLLAYGARIVVVSPQLTPRLTQLATSGAISRKSRRYRSSDVRGAVLVFAATNDRVLNSRISRDAQAAGALVNVVDDPALCSFIVPAVARKGVLQIAVLTDGKSPSVARKIRDQVSHSIDPAYGEFIAFLGELRREILTMRTISQRERQRRLRLLADERLFALYKRHGKRAAREAARTLVGL